MCYAYRPVTPSPLSLGGVDIPSLLLLGHSSLTRVVLAGHYQQLILVDALVPLPSYLAGPGRSRQPIGPVSFESTCPMGGMVSLRWL